MWLIEKNEKKKQKTKKESRRKKNKVFPLHLPNLHCNLTTLTCKHAVLTKYT